MDTALVKGKIQQAVDLLNEFDVDLWLTFVRESSNNPDPILDLIYGTSCTWHSALMIDRSGATVAIVGSLDVANTKESGGYDEVIGYVDSVAGDLRTQLERFNPGSIAINYSEDAVMADGLSHGMWLTLNRLLADTPFVDRFVSSQTLVGSLRGRKSPEELRRITAACDQAQEILAMVTDFLKPGVTEKQVAQFILDEVKRRGLELSWDPTHCPAVFTGPDSAGAHAGPTDRPVERGHIMNIDFGVKVDGYCSDLQRTWYMLKKDESEPPQAVLEGFNTIVEAIELSRQAIKPGRPGHEIDAVARGLITQRGYEEYPHGLGHQVGRVAHDGGGMLGPQWERYGDIVRQPVEVGNVFTIEPRLTVKGHGIATVEEEVVVEADGARYLSRPQTEIYTVS